MSSVRERIERNNRTFRQANEKIRARADELNAPLERIPFLCECPRPSCTEIVFMTLREYTDVRADDTHFLTKAGHEEAERPVGSVVSRKDGYVVVEKSLSV
jgi:hypothetical protein